MGRELVRQLAAEGCAVATCDLDPEALAETAALSTGAKVSTFIADVSSEEQLIAFRDHLRAEHSTEVLHLLFNNAGIGGGGSMIADARGEWETTFNVCWGGVYLGVRTFLPMLLAADAGHIVNTSSVNGLWASLGPTTPHTAYSAAKFAVRGFTEALITDLRVNAPHLQAHVVMPGHIGTGIAINSSRILGRDPKELDAEQLGQLRARLDKSGIDTSGATDDDLRLAMIQRGEDFRDNAPMTAAEASTVILDGVRAGRWRILVGSDAAVLDSMVREAPETIYEPDFVIRMAQRGGLGFTAR